MHAGVGVQDLLDHTFLHPERNKPAATPAPSLGLSEDQLKTIVSQVSTSLASCDSMQVVPALSWRSGGGANMCACCYPTDPLLAICLYDLLVGSVHCHAIMQISMANASGITDIDLLTKQLLAQLSGGGSASAAAHATAPVSVAAPSTSFASATVGAARPPAPPPPPPGGPPPPPSLKAPPPPPPPAAGNNEW